MCLAIPLKVIKKEGQWVTVESDNHSHRVNLSLLKNVKIGDYLIVHGDLALNKISKKEAEKIIKMVGNQVCLSHQ